MWRRLNRFAVARTDIILLQKVRKATEHCRLFANKLIWSQVNCLINGPEPNATSFQGFGNSFGEFFLNLEIGEQLV